MRPDFADVMPRLASEGHRSVLVAPIQFLADHLEILYDVDIAAREQAAAAGTKALWLQLGIVSPEARAIAERAGMDYVENACTAVVHSLYLAGSKPD